MLVRYVNYTIVSVRGFTKKIQKCTTLDRWRVNILSLSLSLVCLCFSDLASASQRRKAEPAATAREPHDRLINLRPMSLKRISAR